MNTLIGITYLVCLLPSAAYQLLIDVLILFHYVSITEILLNPIVGWTLIAFVIAIALFWNKINQFLDRIYEKKQLKEYDAKCHKGNQSINLV